MTAEEALSPPLGLMNGGLLNITRSDGVLLNRGNVSVSSTSGGANFLPSATASLTQQLQMMSVATTPYYPQTKRSQHSLVQNPNGRSTPPGVSSTLPSGLTVIRNKPNNVDVVSSIPFTQ